MNRKQLMPVTEHEDFLAGECDYTLPTCGITPEVYRERNVWNTLDSTDFYQGPNISGDQLHFLNFLGRIVRTAGKCSHLICHHGETTALFTSTSCFDSGIKRK